IIDRPLEAPLVADLPSDADVVRWMTYEPNRLELEVTVAASGLLVLSEVYYPGWTARVDHFPAEVYRANGFLRAVPVEKGTHRVTLSYSPASVRWGAILSVLTFLGAGCAALGARYKRLS